MKNFIIILLVLIGCTSGIVRDPAAFGAVESNYKSLKFVGCNAERPESFTVCYGRHGEAVNEKIRLILPPMPSSVEVVCGNYTREFSAASELILELSEVYGASWDLDKTCIMSVFVKTTLNDMIVFFEAEALIYSYDRGFIPNAPDEVMAWECSVKYSTKGRTKVKCSNL